MRIGASPESASRSRIRPLLAAASLHLALVGDAAAWNPSRQDSIAAAIEQTRDALTIMRALPSDRLLAVLPQADAAPCDALVQSQAPCREKAIATCVVVLTAALDALRVERTSSDRITRELAAAAAPRVGNAIVRLALARDAARARRCSTLTPASDIRPAEVLLALDGRTLEVRPLVALRAGRRYALVAEGFTSDELRAASITTVPRPDPGDGDGLSVPPGAFSARAAAETGLAALPAIPALLGRLEDSVRHLGAAGNATGFRFTLADPVAPERLAAMRLFYVRDGEAPPERTIIRFRTMDPRVGLRDYRRRLAGLGCAAQHAREQSVAERIGLGIGLEHESVARIVRGGFLSLDIGGERGTERLLGVPAPRARPVGVPYELALPWDAGTATPLVIVVGGHRGRAESMLTTHAEPLARRGMATLTLDLPAHGERVGDGQPFLDLLDPSVLSQSLRQAVTDVEAVVHLAQRCGFRLPDGETFRPTAIRYFGYSVGAVVGAMARAIEPALGAAVLVAPGGGIEEWQLVQLPKAVGMTTFVSCSGGPDHGNACALQERCRSPGVCIADPRVMLLHDVLRLAYGLALAGADPLSFATERTGEASKAPLLLITGGNDVVLSPFTAVRLADAYGLHSVAPHVRRGPRARLVQWTDLDHALITDPRVLDQAYAFLASDGRRVSGGSDPPAERSWGILKLLRMTD